LREYTQFSPSSSMVTAVMNRFREFDNFVGMGVSTWTLYFCDLTTESINNLKYEYFIPGFHNT
jgi:hypothetical protein